ncbi:MAG: ACP S-malonyltransferase [Myxococcales bacterium]|nr:ACP S-malonyltransferase [Myxococcales bacterium]
MTIVFMFPGQSSRYPGMLDKLARLHPCADAVLAQAEEALGRDLRAHYRDDNPGAFERNVDVQIGVFVANHMMLAALQGEGIDADVSLGLSLGEYNHLVHIGALAFTDALRLVRARGEAYDVGPRGWMASIQPIDLEALEEAVDTIRGRGLGSLEIVNLNSPRQHVISGVQAAVEAAVELLEDGYYVIPTVIEKQVPMHSSLFVSVGEAMLPHLKGAAFCAPRKQYLPNRLGAPLPEPGHADFVRLLAEHVHTPVLWRKSIDHVLAQHPGAVFVEVGPRQVLINLLDRKWISQVKHATDSREDTARQFADVVAALRPLMSPPHGPPGLNGAARPAADAAEEEAREWPTA